MSIGPQGTIFRYELRAIASDADRAELALRGGGINSEWEDRLFVAQASSSEVRETLSWLFSA